MRSIKPLLIACWLGVAASGFAAQTEARLVLAAEAARPGDTVLAGVHLHMAPEWHTYWKNPGDSGLETKIKWELPAGITAGPIQWPVPEKLTVADLTTYVYQDDVVLIVPLKIPANAAPGPIELKAKVSWLECKELCIPGNQEVHATLNVGAEAKPAPDAGLIQTWQKKLPQPATDLAAQASWEKAASGDTRPLILMWAGRGQKIEAADFYPDPGDQFEVQAATETAMLSADEIRLRKPVKKFKGEWPRQISGVLMQKVGGEQLAYEVSVPIEAAQKKTDAAAMAAPAAGTNSKTAASASPASLWLNLLYAFIGGLILNIMPCVLPVIALKVFSFVKQGGESPGRAKKLSLIYTLGVLASFLVLAAFLIAVQKAGHVVSWGAQMQHRGFVVGMTILVTLVALNLFGVFEVTLSGGAMNAASALSGKSGAPGAFFNGVLATALAIPCTAPFLATALAFAFGQPPGIIVLTFCFVALGLAAPYVALTWNPALLKFLPKPGGWMQRFKIILGFPMLATVVWLYKLSLNHLSKGQALWFGIFLVALAMAAWIWGEFVQRGSARRFLAAVVSLALIAGVGAYAATRTEVLQWQPWSAAAVEQARAAGRPVLVDFTADWCLTCQLNLRTSIDVPKVRARLGELNAVTLIADYTLQNETIGQELHRFGRDAVPLVVVFPKTPGAPPIILPTVLKPQLVLDALDQAAK